MNADLTIADEINEACERGGGPLRYRDLMRMLAQQRARLWICQDMHASAILTPDGVEIFHVYGASWNEDEAAFLLAP